MALFCSCQGVLDVFGGDQQGVGFHPEPGISCAVIFLETGAEPGMWDGRRGGQSDTKTRRSGRVISCRDGRDSSACVVAV
jgi:hypothetical protein